MKQTIKSALVLAAVVAVSGSAFAGVIIHDAAPTHPSFLDLLLAFFRG